MLAPKTRPALPTRINSLLTEPSNSTEFEPLPTPNTAEHSPTEEIEIEEREPDLEALTTPEAGGRPATPDPRNRHRRSFISAGPSDPGGVGSPARGAAGSRIGPRRMSNAGRRPR